MKANIMGLISLGFLLLLNFQAVNAAEKSAETNDKKDKKAQTSVNSISNIQAKEEGPATIRLESSFVGDKEQPTVSYFIPWDGIGTPDKLQWQIGDKIDKTLGLIDRNVLKRSADIYRELNLEMKPAQAKPE